ncbi:MAG TPA: MFS transporter [Beijerinckiaceae bacterium]|nr:MFS transporter [Beijerinckiaceae bacterium]
MGLATSAGWAAFQSADFRFFCAARFLIGLARQAQNVAVGLFVYDVTQSAWALGLTGLFTFAPSMALVLFTGHVADAYDRRVVAMVTDAVSGLAAAGLFVCAWFDISSMWPVYGLVAVAGAARAFGNPASQAMVANLVPRERFANAVAWDQTISQTATISGPAVGGLLYAVDAGLAFAAAGLAAFAATLFTAAIRAHTVKPAREKVSLRTLAAGLTFIRSKPVILGAITLDFIAVMFGGVTALLPIFAQEVLNVGPWGVGVLRSMQAVGALCMATLLAHWPLTDRRAGMRLLQGVAVYGLATVVFGLSTNFFLSAACMFVIGAADMVSLVVRMTLVQIDTPDSMRGRVAAVNSFLTGGSNSLGEFESGAVAALIGAVPTVIIGGIASIGLAVLWARLFPNLRDRDRLIPEPREEAHEAGKREAAPAS